MSTEHFQRPEVGRSCVKIILRFFFIYSGDDVSSCRPCPPRSNSAEGSPVCACDMVLLRSEVFSTLHFNITTGACDIVPDSLVPYLNDKVWALTAPNSQTRSQQLPCDPGSYCADGVRRRCPAGYAGALTMETSPTCDGPCAAGFYCLEGSTSRYSIACGGYPTLRA